MCQHLVNAPGRLHTRSPELQASKYSRAIANGSAIQTGIGFWEAAKVAHNLILILK